jgi:2Fe-2S ferredoxin
MPTIHVVPLNVEYDATGDISVMGAAQAAGYYWPTTCGGEGRCTTCACEVLEGAELLTPMAKWEQKSLVNERGERVLQTNVRLACQARVRGEGSITIRKSGVRPPGQ